MKIIGIDPGVGGGIAVIEDGVLTHSIAMPKTEHDICDFIRQHQDADAAVIESVHSMPKQGVESTFTFGQNYGFLRGVLVACKISFVDCTPGKWQGALGVKTIKNEAYSAHKNRLKGHAQQLYPKQSFTLKNCDAALIAHYGWITHESLWRSISAKPTSPPCSDTSTDARR